MKPQPWLIVVFVAALVGLVFAGVSTYDFVQHLDRQVHSLHCSFIPGMGNSAGESGCQVAMMSSYSSVLRSTVWGGIPISLPAMAVFAFIGVFAIDLMLTRRKDDPRATGFLALATALPALASIVMLTISLTQLGTTCKLCVCIYAASALCLIGAIVVWRGATRQRGTEPARAERSRKQDQRDEPAWVGAAKEPAATSQPAIEPMNAAPVVSTQFLAGAFGVGVLFVLVPVLVYLAKAPDHGRFIGTCDALTQPADTYGVMVRLDSGNAGGAPAIEILDPLCPACRAFEDRLSRSGYAERLDRRAILFPLDNTCNWMVTEATHPGACTISEAVLCAGDRAPAVIAWAFEAQERVRDETKKDPAAAARIVKERFPELAACVGSPEAKSRLNKSLRWAVANNIKVLTPQLFIDNVKLCDEDVDLGLEYSLGVMLERHDAHTLMPPAGSVATPVETMPHDTGSAAVPATTEPVKPAGTEPATTEPATPATNEPAKPATEPAKPATTEPGKPTPPKQATEPAKPATEPAKPATEPARPATTEPVKPTPPKPATEPAKPATEPAKPAEPGPVTRPSDTPTETPPPPPAGATTGGSP